jgi:hypothetical protein
LMPAPTIEQTPVAVRPASPISRARRGSVPLLLPELPIEAVT